MNKGLHQKTWVLRDQTVWVKRHHNCWIFPQPLAFMPRVSMSLLTEALCFLLCIRQTHGIRASLSGAAYSDSLGLSHLYCWPKHWAADTRQRDGESCQVLREACLPGCQCLGFGLWRHLLWLWIWAEQLLMKTLSNSNNVTARCCPGLSPPWVMFPGTDD